MIETVRQVLEAVLANLHDQVTTFWPPALAALIILLGAYVMAIVVRFVLRRIFKGIAADRLLRRCGLIFLISRSGKLRATRMVSETAYWLILAAGFLSGLSVFNTSLTSRMTQEFILLLPKLVMAGMILLAGIWLGYYVSRGALIEAVNAGIPHARKIADAVRIVIIFAAAVAAAEYLNFARSVFLAAFIIVLGGAVLAASLAFGLGFRDAAKHLIEDGRGDRPGPRSLWSHL